MKKGNMKHLVVAVFVLTFAIVAVFGVISAGKSKASGYDHGYTYDFNKMHVRNVYQSNEKNENGQIQTQKTVDLFVAEAYAGGAGKIYMNVTDYTSGCYVNNIFFERSYEDTITTNDGKQIKGYVYTATIWANKDARYKATITNCTNMDYIIDNNGGHGYEMKF